MATKSINAKSQTIAARVPLEIASAVEELKDPGESTRQFVTVALKREVIYRQRKQGKEDPKG